MAQKKYVSLEKLGLYHEKEVARVNGLLNSAKSEVKSYADSLGVNYDAAGSAATVQGNLDSEIARAKAAEEVNAAAAKQAQDEVDALELVVAGKAAQSDLTNLVNYVGTIPEGATSTNVVAYVQEKTSGIASEGAMTELGNRVGVVEGKVATIEGDYLKAADKTELEGKITAEAERAAGVESGLDTRVKAIEDDYLKAADKNELTQAIATAKQEAVATVLGEGVDEDFDTLKEVAEWILSDTTGAAALQTKVATLEGEMDTVQADVEQAQSDIDAVEAAVATKVEQEAYNTKIAALEGVDSDLTERIGALEAKHGNGEGTVESLIATAKQEAIDAAASAADTKDEAILAAAKKYADDEDAKIEERVGALETASATHALASDVTALAGRVTTVEGKVTTLEGEMDAVEALAAANKSAHEANAAAIALKASQADLEAAVARIAANETVIANFVECSEEEINALFA